MSASIKDTPFGIIPYLEIKSSGQTLTGNATIARYLAEKYSEFIAQLLVVHSLVGQKTYPHIFT